MNPNELLGRTFDCDCGRTHEVPTKGLLYCEDALEHLPHVLSDSVEQRRLVIVADRRTWSIVGERSQQILVADGWVVESVIVPDTDRGGPVCDDTTLQWLKDKMPECAIVLAAGSGVINDLAKWAAFELGIPYAVVATAATMNGYTSANVAPTIDGVKMLIPARAPVAVFAAPSIIAGAPFELTAAGLGDVIAKPVSTADWRLNNIFSGEYFCRYCSEMLNGIEPLYFDHPQDIRDRQPQAIEALYNALLYSGIGMTIIGTSAPASGGEHLLSHTLDMMSSVDGIPHALHGRQVGIGTLFASALYELILQVEACKCREMPGEIDGSFWGPLSDNVSWQYKQKRPVFAAIRDKLTDGKTWSAFLSASRNCVRPPRQIKDCLRIAGAAHTFADIGCSRKRLLAAILHMHEIRARTTVIDLAWMLGVLPEAAEDIVDSWITA